MKRIEKFVAPVAVAALVWLLCPMVAGAQSELAQLGRGPRFMQPVPGAGITEEVDVTQVAMLRRRVSLNHEGATVAQLLQAITAQSGLRFAYNADLLSADRVVGLRADSITIVAALMEILVDAGVDVLLKSPRQAVLVRRSVPQQNGAISGRVTDAKSGAALMGATVVIEDSPRSTTAGSDGRYRIGSVAPGTYTLRARYIGYTPGTVLVTVTADQEATADLLLQRSAQRLDEVVTTGTLVPTEVKALPTPITVITADDIERQHARRFDELAQLIVPSAFVTQPGTRDAAGLMLSVRGASTLTVQGRPKVYVDGVPVASNQQNAIDPQSIDRIEVVRGPQAAAIYGSDALGGVVQIFTKQGITGRSRPELDVQAALGRVESNFDGSGALRQEYAGAIRGGRGPAHYALGGGYQHTGDWVPEYRHSSPSLYASAGLTEGPMAMSVSARYNQQTDNLEYDPRLAATGLTGPFFTIPQYDQTQYRSESYAARAEYHPASWWQHGLTVGADRLSTNVFQYRPYRLTSADTLLYADMATELRLYFAYHTAVTARLLPGLAGTMTMGIDHSDHTATDFNTFGAVQTNPLLLAPGQSTTPTATKTINTGYFAQAEFDIRGAFFLTAALRADVNSDLGDKLGTPLSPRVGASYVRSLGSTTVKLRAAYGEAIRPPDPGLKDAQNSGTLVRLANVGLRPERQVGPDAGVDLVFGGLGSLSVTYYYQTVRDLIERVTVAAGPPIVEQFQNLARGTNSGWEFEGSLDVGRVAVKGQFAITRTHPVDLGPDYNGDLRVGEQVYLIPVYTGGLTLAASPFRRLSVSAGIGYTGKRREYDWVSYYSCLGGTRPCRNADFSFGDYLTPYSGFATVNASIERQFVHAVTAYLGIENLTNSGELRGFGVLSVTPGRIMTIGIRVRS